MYRLDAPAMSWAIIRTGPMMVACQWNYRNVSMLARGFVHRGHIGERLSRGRLAQRVTYQIISDGAS